jgi:hypothetical protein
MTSLGDWAPEWQEHYDLLSAREDPKDAYRQRRELLPYLKRATAQWHAAMTEYAMWPVDDSVIAAMQLAFEGDQVKELQVALNNLDLIITANREAKKKSTE